MTTPTRSNPAYAHLAYQTAIADQVIEDILERYIGNEVGTAVSEIECVQLAREDATVPQEEILHFLDRLKNYKASTTRELNRFEFVRRDDEQGFGIGHPTLYPTRSQQHGQRPLDATGPQSKGTSGGEGGQEQAQRKRRGRRGGRRR